MFGEKIGKTYRLDALNRNLVKTVLENGGTLVPLLINALDSKGLGLCNPSVFIDNGKPMMILRNVNYTLYHAENTQSFNSRYGPLSYLNPEDDIHLRTWNFLCQLNPDTLEIDKYWKIDTSKLDKEPLWEFIGLEDARLVRWNGSLYGIGVRRDTTTNGQGRMELSQLALLNDSVKEISRNRIENTDPKAYCEKNWMPIIDMPNCFVKWTNPTAVVEVDLKTNTCKHIYHGKETIPDLPFFRGSTQVIPWGPYRICLVHDCDLFSNRLEQKDATYLHRFIVWDKDWNIVKIGDPFSFMDGEIEFSCGMALYKEDLLITFGFQDNAAYLLRIPKDKIMDIIGLGKNFDWGLIKQNEWFLKGLKKETKDDIYQKYFKVEEGDIVLDIGASVGPFTHAILGNKPSKVICVEPHSELYKTLVSNVGWHTAVTCYNSGVALQSGLSVSNSLFDPEQILASDKHVEFMGISFKDLVGEVDHIDFLKIDCEGGEYDVFTEDNLPWIKANVRKIAGEVHLRTPEEKASFRRFRDLYFKAFPNFQVSSFDGFNIKWDVWNEHFFEYYYNCNFYIDNRPDRWNTTYCPSLEITTSIPKNGCVVNCTFCPQEVLKGAYIGERVLSLANFKKLVNKVPTEVTIVFAGFTEPFQNKECADMIVYAHDKGHQVSVFTTAVGMKVEDVEKIKHIPFYSNQGGFVLHLPDKEGYAGHKPDNMKVLFRLKDNNIHGFSTATMGTLHPEIAHLFPNTHRQAMWNRAGNLESDSVNKAEVKTGLTTCNCFEKLYHNVLLPDGSITLCCMDYGLRHILGNLHSQEYNDIIPLTDEPFELCKHCENGKLL
jgi:FkbM family methyltransferase